MIRARGSSTGAGGGGQRPKNRRRGDAPANVPSARPPYKGRKHKFHQNYRRVTGSIVNRRHNFTIQLNFDNRSFNVADVEDIVARCNSKAENYRVKPKGSSAAELCFEQWIDTLEAMVCLWKIRLEDGQIFTPSLNSNLLQPSDTEELTNQLKLLFINWIKDLIEGDLVAKWENKLSLVCDEIVKVTASLRSWNRISIGNELTNKKTGLNSEKVLIERKIEEFKSAMECVLTYLEGNPEVDSGGEVMEIFKFSSCYDWERIHHLIMRECRRLNEGLPIYAFRQELLRHIYNQQIMVMIGETGSGKSTQLVQYLADSGFDGDGSIICTQPRKLAAISLARRVQEETGGCYPNNSIVCRPTYSSTQRFDSKVIYMTDHCLLQHYMNDTNLTGISCIVIDEAHERSLNTDLLLALIKSLLHHRLDLRLIIMSATIDAERLANYFFGCGTFHVVGRNFPVDIKYVPCASVDTAGSTGVASYVSEVVRVASEINRTEKEGGILAFLTSQMEVEWACEKFQAPSTIALPLHGKLSCEDQHRIFLDYPGKRKVIFATNIAETSLTIPGVNYVVDSGMVKDSRFEPGTGMNILRVNRISQSSANQRAGRAGRTEPGRCFRLYSEDDYELMLPHQEPEIRKVHIGVAVLRILALGIKNVQGFDFVDAPSTKAIEMAVKNLIQLGAVTWRNEVLELTEEGLSLMKLGIEPRLGKIILGCFRHRLGREGLILAAVMANASSIFCRVGTEENKLISDCLKVQFCHRNGDLFTLLSVYKEWEGIPHEKKNKWCWDNSINAKSLRRCQDTVKELETCAKNELNYTIPSYWMWNPHMYTEHDEHLKTIILSSLAENVAIYSGYDELGYEVALTRKHVQLHPTCSLLVFSQRPSWVVFGDILSVSNDYLVCATAIDFDSLSTLCPPPPFEASRIEREKLHERTLTGYGSTLLKRFCGRSNSNLLHLVSRIRTACQDERIRIDVNINQNKLMLFASEADMENVNSFVIDALGYERKLLYNECMEKLVYHGGPSVSSSLALFGAGAEIKHLELKQRVLTVDVFYSNVKRIDDRELLMFLERYTSGNICEIHKFSSTALEGEDKEKWGRITFLTPDAANKAEELNQVDFRGSLLKVVPSRSNYRGDHKMFSFPAVKAKVYWPRRRSKGFGIVKCYSQDVDLIVEDLSNVLIGENYIQCEPSFKHVDSVVISGLDRDLSEAEILDTLRVATKRRILDFFLVRKDAVVNNRATCEEALLRELSGLIPKRNPHGSVVGVQVFPPEPKDAFMRALITFDGSFHLEAAKALEQIEGEVLPGCFSWQKIKCQQLFQSTVSCPAPVYFVIKKKLDSLLASAHRRGVEWRVDRNENGSYRVKISTIATKTVAELRGRLEQLMKGKIVCHPRLSLTILQLLFNRDGIMLMKSLQRETGTYIFFDRQNMNVRIFGSLDKIDIVHQRLVESLLILHESKQLEVHLRGGARPPDLMKEVVKKFGPHLQGLKEKLPGAEFTLNTRHHVISVKGNIELKQKVEDIIYEVAQTNCLSVKKAENKAACPICLCEVEDAYRLEGCGHVFCRLCLVEQCDSAIKSRDNIPIRCVHEGCGSHILLSDLRFLLSGEKLEELFRASLAVFVAANFGTYRFCPSPDCPSVYQVADPSSPGMPFLCEACYVETCTRCHSEYHPYLTCEKYKEFKDDPDSSLKEWCKDKEHVKQCPVCGFTIEKVDGCNHVECKCGRHICWVCLEFFGSSDNCYDHLRSIHSAIT